jgi:hypothetical protein
MYGSVASTTFMCFSDRKFTPETRGLKVKTGCLLFLCRMCSICYSMDIDDSNLSVHFKIHFYVVPSRCCKALNLSMRSWHQNWLNTQKIHSLIRFVFLFQTHLEMSWLFLSNRCELTLRSSVILLLPLFIVSKIKVVKWSQQRIIKHSNW